MLRRLPQVGVTDLYEQLVDDKMKAYKAKTSRQKYAKSDHYQKFKQAIYVSSVMPLYMNRC